MSTSIQLERAQDRASSSNSKQFTVFIVEDSYASRSLLENYLTKLPRSDKSIKLDIHTFESGEDCIKNLDKDPDIIVLDYFLDEVDPNAMDGLSTLREIRQEQPNAEIVVMSNQKDVMVVSELFNTGIHSYISKEHACHVRVEEAVLKIIEQRERERRRRTRALLYSVLFFITGVCLGYWLHWSNV